MPALATPPVIGNYSPDEGRFSESWKGGQEGAKDNTINAMSWDGSALGGQWTLQCMVAAAQAQETDRDIDEFGYGYVKYETNYGGGSLWLSGSGPWGDGSEDYTCTIGPVGMKVTVTHLYEAGVRVAAVSDITIRGVFDNYSNCFRIRSPTRRSWERVRVFRRDTRSSKTRTATPGRRCTAPGAR